MNQNIINNSINILDFNKCRPGLEVDRPAKSVCACAAMLPVNYELDEKYVVFPSRDAGSTISSTPIHKWGFRHLPSDF